jgi:hypothetical protein
MVFGGQAAFTQWRNMNDTVMRAAFSDPNLAANLRIALDAKTATPQAQKASAWVFNKLKDAGRYLYDIASEGSGQIVGQQAATIGMTEEERVTRERIR